MGQANKENKESVCYLQINGSEFVSECVEGEKRMTGNGFSFLNVFFFFFFAVR